jgi:predicted short-subunit dehydrogenase-like oxidoreductase (DUF2520 family)
MALTLARRGWTVAVADRDARKARALARRFGFSAATPKAVALAVISVPDPAIPAAARALARRRLPPALAVHLSGAVPADALSPLARAGWRTAKAHPVFAFPAEPAPLPPRVAFGVAASDPADLREVERLVHGLKGIPVRIRPGRDAAWHLASVIAGNFLHAQLLAAGSLLEGAAAVPPAGAAALLAPLVRSSLENALAGGRAGLTGPVARGDAKTLETHLGVLLNEHPEFSMYYASATALLLRLLPPLRRAALRRRLKRVGMLI